jgi:tetratricopeptide (TPR) repeat protein
MYPCGALQAGDDRVTAQLNEVITTARRYLEQEEYARSLEAVESELVADPQDIDLLLLMADSLVGLGRFAEALPLTIMLVTRSPDASGHWLALCSALRGVGYIDLAMRVNSHALQHAMLELESVRFQGDTLFEGNRFDEARAAYQPALKQFGQEARAWRIWYNYSSCLYAEGRVSDSREADRRALRLLQQFLAIGSVTGEKRLAALWFHQGMLQFRLSQWLLAEQAFYQALRSDIDSLAALWLRNTYRKEGKRLSAMLMLPWAFRNGWLDTRRKSIAQDEMLRQRASIPPETLLEVERLIAS